MGEQMKDKSHLCHNRVNTVVAFSCFCLLPHAEQVRLYIESKICNNFYPDIIQGFLIASENLDIYKTQQKIKI